MKYPSSIRITGKVRYQILWVYSFENPEQLGECHPDRKQIVIKNGLTDKLTRDTFIHEVLHAINFEIEKLTLTEKQTELLEMGISRVLNLNGKIFHDFF